eukprot:SAG25_NODE_6693_length_537_cov_1.381279_1_plen_34_part_10
MSSRALLFKRVGSDNKIDDNKIDDNKIDDNKIDD